MRQDHADRRHLEATAPELVAVLRQAERGEVQSLSDAGEQRLVEQVNARLTPAQIREFRSGNAEALEGIPDDPHRQLELAKTWLQANKVAPGDPARPAGGRAHQS